MELSTLAAVLGFFLDLMLGDPHWLYHPVRLIGLLISGLEKLLRALFPKNARGELAAGVCLLILTAGTTFAAVCGLLHAAGLLHPYVRFALEVILSYQVLAVKSLRTETMRVYEALQEEDLEKARRAVSMVVGRDTAALDDIGVTKAAVETVAENTSDGVVAPLFYLLIGGAPLGFFYKAVNTMDSMVGYKNDRYLYFGRAAAKFDDVLNYFPARISAVLMSAAAALLKMDGAHAWSIWRRDRYNHSSPNSAQTEAACAGALHIRLAGDAYYFGKLYEKPTIGDDDRPVEYEDIRRANRLLYGTAALALILFTAVKGVVIWLIV